MHLVRLAVTLGQCDQKRWKNLQRQLCDSRCCSQQTVLDVRGIREARACLHGLVHSFFLGLPQRSITQGVLSRYAEKRGELTALIERGHSRLAHINLLLRSVLSEGMDINKVNSSEHRDALDNLTGMFLGDCELGPKLAVILLSAIGNEVIRRASTLLELTPSPEGIPQHLPEDIARLRLSSSGALDTAGQQVAVAVTKLAAVLDVTDALANWGEDLTAKVAERGATLRNKLLLDIHMYKEDNRADMDAQVTEHLGTAQDFIAESALNRTDQASSANQLDILMSLLNVMIIG